MILRRKIIFFVLFFCLLIAFFYSFLFLKNSNGYNTIGGIKVTKDNLFSLVETVPKDLEKKVKDWFAKDNAYEILVKQKELLTDVGTVDFNCWDFFDSHSEVKNIGGMNYVFKLPINGQSFIIKISGPSNRFYNTISSMGFDIKAIYFRRFYLQDQKQYCKYVTFDEDKERIRKYFYICCPRNLLNVRPTILQLKNLIYMVSGAVALEGLAGIVEYELVEKYLKNPKYSPRNIGQVFEDLLDSAFDVIDKSCYKKSDLENKKFLDTFNTASRVFHIARFNEAIDKFNLDKLQKPPKGYLINLNPNNKTSSSDRDVVFVQEFLKDCKTIDFYIQKKQEVVNEIFTKELIFQLCKALEYSGLWDINGDNILVNTKNNKILYMDFEHNRHISASQAFNNSKDEREDGFCEALIGFFKLFKGFPRQLKYVYNFIEENNIDINSYIEKRVANSKKRTRNYEKFSPLGFAVCYDDTDCKRFKMFKSVVGKKLLESE